MRPSGARTQNHAQSPASGSSKLPAAQTLVHELETGGLGLGQGFPDVVDDEADDEIGLVRDHPRVVEVLRVYLDEIVATGREQLDRRGLLLARGLETERIAEKRGH